MRTHIQVVKEDTSGDAVKEQAFFNRYMTWQKTYYGDLLAKVEGGKRQAGAGGRGGKKGRQLQDMSGKVQGATGKLGASSKQRERKLLGEPDGAGAGVKGQTVGLGPAGNSRGHSGRQAGERTMT